jgi:hypothetical protein
VRDRKRGTVYSYYKRKKGDSWYGSVTCERRPDARPIGDDKHSIRSSNHQRWLAAGRWALLLPLTLARKKTREALLATLAAEMHCSPRCASVYRQPRLPTAATAAMSCLFGTAMLRLTGPCLVFNFNPEIPLCKKKILIISKCWHMYGVLNVDEIKN